ncbi:SusC/RagA family TonB-linked outer membrane protein, partial [Fulvivirga lutimaris]|uniref:SusC/RagA family TonB-linked outer membrane protein n=1 Tax=Fulvivirga lutimaris TaxID=1819566 RepID=UPI0012BBB9CB
RYSISASSGDVLVFSFIGYLTQEVPVGARSTIDVTMAIDAQQLSEVVVVGYGTQSRAEVTGAISTIEADQINSLPVARVDQALQGQAPGVTVINNGAPGDEPTIRIRGLGTTGNNAPLYVIDGVIASGIGDLNSQDIESIQVLKDASTAAVYGSKGSNGVIIVTTKKGRPGKIQVSANAYAGTQWTNKRFDLLNTDQYLQYASEAFSSPTRASDPQYANLFQSTTDWQDAIFQAGTVQNYNVSVAGGGENNTFRVSGGYLSQEGVVRSTDYDRYNFRANSTFNIGKKLEIGENLSLAYSEQSPLSASGGRSVIEHAIKVAPYLPIFDDRTEGGFRGPNSGLDGGNDAENPVRVLELGSRNNQSVALLGNIYGEYQIIDGLTFKSQIGLDYRTSKYHTFTPTYNDDPEGATHSSTFARIRINDAILASTYLTNSLRYKKSFNEVHNVEVLLLAEQTRSKSTFLNTYSQNYITNQVEQISNVDADVGSSEFNYYRLGYLGRVNYSYKEKYIVAASIRRDGSSRLGSNEKWGWFPSFAAGWNIGKEQFFASSNIVNDLKLRASYGQTGNDNFGDYSATVGIESDFHYPIGGEDAVGAVPQGLGNNDLVWESTKMTNIGLDFTLFDYAINGSLEVYNNTSDDLIINRQLPVSLGYPNPARIENSGSIETKGIELNLGYDHFGGEVEWSVSMNLGTSTNEVISLGGVEQFSGGGFENENISYVIPGERAFQFYGWQFDGIFDSDAEANEYMGGSQYNDLNARGGDFRIVDTDGDGEITADDRTIIGNPFPKLTYGLNGSVRFKGFDLSLFFSGVYGNEIYNTNIYDLEGMPRLFNAGVAVLNRWTPTNNTEDGVPRAGGAATNTQISSRFVEDGSFARLRNLTLGYDLRNIVKVDGISKFRVYVSAMNLLTFTDYSGLDPEVGQQVTVEPGQAPQVQGTTATTGGIPIVNFENGIDRGNYPVPKTFTAGIEITF